jgi:hypothetical protein
VFYLVDALTIDQGLRVRVSELVCGYQRHKVFFLRQGSATRAGACNMVFEFTHTNKKTFLSLT